jgi:hypothetical protein
VYAIEHKLTIEIKGILCTKQMRLINKEYLVKYKGCHHKEIMWMKPIHLDHLSNIVAKFGQEGGHELGVKRT